MGYKKRYSIEAGVIAASDPTENPEYAKDLEENPPTEDEDPTDTLDQFQVTVTLTVYDDRAAQILKCMAEENQRVLIVTD